jgi:hypothetical protein
MTVLQNHFHQQLYMTNKSRDEIDRLLGRLRAGRASKGDRRWVGTVRSSLCGIYGCDCTKNELGERKI